MSEKTTHKSMGWRSRMHEIIFEADTFEGKLFDVALLIAILLSILVVMLESVDPIRASHGELLRNLEWFFTILFTIEYIARIIVIRKPTRYVFSFLGIVDFLSTIPTYLSLIIVGSQSLLILRTIRLLRVFRIFKLSRYMGEASVIRSAMMASRRKITVFLGLVVIIVIIVGTLMYLVEGKENGFTSIPRSIYWAIVTLTTVGYGDIAPVTVFGQTIASVLMILGYAIIAVPTGIVTTEFTMAKKQNMNTQSCPVCSREGHDDDAMHCKYCGSKL
ncbi:ion transporter [Saccharicrinis sp. FJH54]|uniref:ion transporter n=1 Tax=Saccharicrinis sp. FJH54 TaxID=3344665 RepID=UPI0035D51366